MEDRMQTVQKKMGREVQRQRDDAEEAAVEAIDPLLFGEQVHTGDGTEDGSTTGRVAGRKQGEIVRRQGTESLSADLSVFPGRDERKASAAREYVAGLARPLWLESPTDDWILRNTNLPENEIRMIRAYIAANGLFVPELDPNFWKSLGYILSGPRVEAFSASAVEEAIRQAAMVARRGARGHPWVRHLYDSLRVMRARRRQGELQIAMRGLDLVAAELPGISMREHVLQQSKAKALPPAPRKALPETSAAGPKGGRGRARRGAGKKGRAA
jgi:hypothetical protein